jgi:hypothetical protein
MKDIAGHLLAEPPEVMESYNWAGNAKLLPGPALLRSKCSEDRTRPHCSRRHVAVSSGSRESVLRLSAFQRFRDCQ